MIKILKKIIIPLMRLRERKLYGDSEDSRHNFEIMKECCKNVFDVKNFCDNIIYKDRKSYNNYIQHPGYTLSSRMAICKDIAFLFKAMFPDGYYVEIWKTLFDGHVYFVYGEYVIDFTSVHGIRIRRRASEKAIDAASYYYGDFIFAKVNDKILSKYGIKESI